MNIIDSSKICRACLEPSEKMYSLHGSIANVDVEIATMISYCTSSELHLDENLPDSVCIPCFKIIRISYNFLRQFKESQEQLLRQKIKNDNEEKADEIDNVTNEDIKLLHYDVDVVSSETDYLTYKFEEIHNYAQKFTENENCSERKPFVTDVVEDSDELSDNVEYILPDYSNLNEESSTTQATSKKSVPSEDSSVNVNVCPICKSTFLNLKKFNEHVLLHNANVITCNKCPTPLMLNMSQYIKHYKEFHRYQCNVCGKNLISNYGFRYHMKLHENSKRYACPVKDCSKSYVFRYLLKRHMSVHSETMKYECNLCQANFKRYDTYWYHLKTHDGKRNHPCNQCGKAFFQAVHLRDHMLKHSGHKQFSCDGCDRSFITNSQLKRHIRRCLPK